VGKVGSMTREQKIVAAAEKLVLYRAQRDAEDKSFRTRGAAVDTERVKEWEVQMVDWTFTIIKLEDELAEAVKSK
jgi:hypothetical protein